MGDDEKNGFAALLVMALAIAACGGGGEDLSDRGGGESSSAESPGLPNFLIPAPNGVVTILATSLDAQQFEYAGSEIDRVVAFYEDWTSDQPESYIRLDFADNAGVSWARDLEDGSVYTINVGMVEIGDREMVQVTLIANDG